jgi:cysteine desulfurase/selenocysteine lyase
MTRLGSTPPSAQSANPSAGLNIDFIRSEFPVLARKIRGKQLVYLDNAASTQKPQQVIDAISNYYSQSHSNVHRGVHTLSQEATDLYEGARGRVGKFIGAQDTREIIFVRGATEAINLVAHSFVRPLLKPGDEIAISGLEHHSNIVPWQLLCEEKGSKLAVIPVTDNGEIDTQEMKKILARRPRILAINHVSNALGTVNPLREIVTAAHSEGVPVMVDGAQAMPHLAVDMQQLGCDFYCFSGHKMFGPTGIGVLYGRLDMLESLVPYQGGGDMILSVSFEGTIFNELPYRLEAGTPNIAGVVGLGAAVDYLTGIQMAEIQDYEDTLCSYALERIDAIPEVRIIGKARHRAGVVSFLVGDVHPHDVGTILDQKGIAVRAGHHCAQPVMERFGVPATVRASFAFYNTRQEVDTLCEALEDVTQYFN